MPVALTDDWVIERFVRLAKPGEGEDMYEPWPGYDKAMTQAGAERALDECVRRWAAISASLLQSSTYSTSLGSPHATLIASTAESRGVDATLCR
jgi:hypothetical protein